MSLQLGRSDMRAGATQRSSYLSQIQQFPLLEARQEYLLAKRWRELGDQDAADRLVTSHLRLVAKIARGNLGYGIALAELISEGNIGLLHAVKRFEPDRGVRLATYASWWIKAAIQEYILRSWSLVKIGTTANQKKLFFNLRKEKSRIAALDTGDLRCDQTQLIADRLGVAGHEVTEMNRRIDGDVSLHSSIHGNGFDDGDDRLVDGSANQEDEVAEKEELDIRSRALERALSALDERERRIFVARRLTDKPPTHAELADKFGVSAERVRQIEQRAFNKVQGAVRGHLAAIDLSRRFAIKSEVGEARCGDPSLIVTIRALAQSVQTTSKRGH
jgi:RNA polymerase sigma-32 factor